jgi:hypothetical protein
MSPFGSRLTYSIEKSLSMMNTRDLPATEMAHQTLHSVAGGLAEVSRFQSYYFAHCRYAQTFAQGTLC